MARPIAEASATTDEALEILATALDDAPGFVDIVCGVSVTFVMAFAASGPLCGAVLARGLQFRHGVKKRGA